MAMIRQDDMIIHGLGDVSTLGWKYSIKSNICKKYKTWINANFTDLCFEDSYLPLSKTVWIEKLSKKLRCEFNLLAQEDNTNLDIFNSCERKYLNLEESKIPAIPMTIFVGKPEYFCNAITIMSKGFVMQITNALGEVFFIPSATCFIIFKFVSNKSSLDIPGFLGIPAVIIITSEFSVSS